MTAGSGDPYPPAGSSAKPSSPTGRRTASGRSRATAAGSPTATGRSRAPKRSRRARAASGQRLFAFDRRLGTRFVAGADEAGRGCLAGPLIAAAVLFDLARLTRGELRALKA